MASKSIGSSHVRATCQEPQAERLAHFVYGCFAGDTDHMLKKVSPTILIIYRLRSFQVTQVQKN